MKYCVSIAVAGRAYIDVEAASPEEAKRLAERKFGDVNCGEITDIEWRAVNCDDENGNIHDF